MQRHGIFAGDDPFDIAQSWLEAAHASEPCDANAIALATCGSDAFPNVRMVLLKEIERNENMNGAFVFYSNKNSTKGQEIAQNSTAALLFYWRSLGRQIRIRGSVSLLEEEKADAYFATRPLLARIGAWASKQSEVLESQTTLMAKVAEYGIKFAGKPPRPPHWVGYRLVPTEMEFWAQGANRLHNRFLWTRKQCQNDPWHIKRLYP